MSKHYAVAGAFLEGLAKYGVSDTHLKRLGETPEALAEAAEALKRVVAEMRNRKAREDALQASIASTDVGSLWLLAERECGVDSERIVAMLRKHEISRIHQLRRCDRSLLIEFGLTESEISEVEQALVDLGFQLSDRMPEVED